MRFLPAGNHEIDLDVPQFDEMVKSPTRGRHDFADPMQRACEPPLVVHARHGNGERLKGSR